MRFMVLLFLGSSALGVNAQSYLYSDSLSMDYLHFLANKEDYQKQWIVVEAEKSRILTTTTYDQGFHKVYLVDENGSSVDQGFTPVKYFAPNNNRLVISGLNRFQDSLNPYGALNIGEALLLGTINQFISGISKPRKRNPQPPTL